MSSGTSARSINCSLFI